MVILQICYYSTTFYAYKSTGNSTTKKSAIENFHDSYEAVVLCADDDNPRLDHNMIRGYGGAATFWRKELNGKAKHMVSVPPRIIVTEISTKDYIICIINVYMPADNSNCDLDYKNTLAQIQEVMNTFCTTHEILICGDLNASLKRMKTRDKTFQSFVLENSLTPSEKFPTKNTFFHHNQKYETQIDYFLFRNNTKINIYDIRVRDLEATNLSDHTVLTVRIKGVPTPKAGTKPTNKMKITTKPIWNKVDVSKYRSSIQTNISSLSKTTTVEEKVTTLTKIIHKAGNEAVPNYRKTKSKKPKGQSIWNREIANISKISKQLFHKWKSSGRRDDTLKASIRHHKKLLRQLQRQAMTRCNNKYLGDIMNAKENNTKLFHELINRQRKTANRNTTMLVVDGVEVYEPERILEGWRSHFETLANPVKSSDGGSNGRLRLTLAKEQNKIIEEREGTDDTSLPPISQDDIIEAIKTLNKGKAEDMFGLTAENLLYAVQELAEPITEIIDQIFTDLDVPETLKRGILTPVHKKGKDKLHTGNYRGIVVTSIISKVLDSIIKKRLDNIFTPKQNSQQRGFTDNSSSLNAAFLITETILWSKQQKQPLYLTTLDAQKAFDTVDHEILFNKLYHLGIKGHLWVLLRNLNRNITLQVKWENQLSGTFCMNQGTMQGSKLSTTLYKIYHNELLETLENSTLGPTIGKVRLPAPTCADDTALLATTEAGMQGMLNIVEAITAMDCVKINPEKSEIVRYNTTEDIDVNLGQIHIKHVESTKHLGIVRNPLNRPETDKRIKMGIQTMYAMLGPNLNARKGFSPMISHHVWKIYAIPRCLYGLEVLNMTKQDLNKLEIMQRNILKHLQALPDRTSSIAVYSLIGAEPIETILDKNNITLFTNISRLQGAREHEILRQQLSLGLQPKGSLIDKTRFALQKLKRPTPEEIFRNPPKKNIWARQVKKAVATYWEAKWTQEIQEKPSLKSLNLQHNPSSSPHNLWKAANSNIHEVRRAEIKAKLITGCYPLQTNAANNKKQTSRTCLVCNEEDEDIGHFILRCQPLENNRTTATHTLTMLCDGVKPNSYQTLVDRGLLLQLV